jgi:hypothetical protein
MHEIYDNFLLISLFPKTFTLSLNNNEELTPPTRARPNNKKNKQRRNKILIIKRTNHNQTKNEWSRMHKCFPW